MGKIHLLMRKEDINRQQMDGKIAVVFDILLATSTLTAALSHGAKEVIPVKSEKEALREAEDRPKGSYLLIGESKGLPIEKFSSPSPLQLAGKVKGKTVILSTTNGTVAIKNARTAKQVFAASLLNGQAVADKLRKNYKDDTIILVCSGSMGRFCLEDFYGAGYFLDCLVGPNRSDWDLTDAASAALLFYQGADAIGSKILEHSRIGQLFENDGFLKVIRYVAQRGVSSVVPFYDGHAIVNIGP